MVQKVEGPQSAASRKLVENNENDRVCRTFFSEVPFLEVAILALFFILPLVVLFLFASDELFTCSLSSLSSSLRTGSLHTFQTKFEILP